MQQRTLLSTFRGVKRKADDGTAPVKPLVQPLAAATPGNAAGGPKPAKAPWGTGNLKLAADPGVPLPPAAPTVLASPSTAPVQSAVPSRDVDIATSAAPVAAQPSSGGGSSAGASGSLRGTINALPRTTAPAVATAVAGPATSPPRRVSGPIIVASRSFVPLTPYFDGLAQAVQRLDSVLCANGGYGVGGFLPLADAQQRFADTYATILPTTQVQEIFGVQQGVYRVKESTVRGVRGSRLGGGLFVWSYVRLTGWALDVVPSPPL